MAEHNLRRGDLVEVRSGAEILATLDDRGELGGMPFMPEMIPYLGTRHRVARRADKVCDTIHLDMTSRLMSETVFLDSVRCDGSGHDGCQAECLVYWNEAWLRRIDDDAPLTGEPDSGTSTSADEQLARDELLRRTSANSAEQTAEGDGRHRCQATQLLVASRPTKVYDPVPYLHELTARNVRLGRWVKVMGRVAVMQTGSRIGRLAHPVLKGPTATTPSTPPLDLQVGERVRVKSPEQIALTLNDQGKNRGLWFDREMLAYCGGVYRVRKRVTRIINEATGGMMTFTNDCIMLEGVICTGELSLGRWFCGKEIYLYWREAWLERVDEAP
jgi:hypothetical protein